MKAVFIILFFCAHIYSMDSVECLEQAASHEPVAEAIKLKVLEGPDNDWHFFNSFVQAIICPTSTQYNEEGIFFSHYEYSHIYYGERYQKIQEFLPLLSESAHDLEGSACQVMRDCTDLEKLTEKQKLRIARAWIHQFLKDQIDSPLIPKRKQYLDALKAGDHVELAKIAPHICHYTVTLLEEIKQRYTHFLT